MGSPYETAETLRLFAIGDLHLPGGQGKPMDVFGDQWQDHFRHIEQDWRARVREQDVVLIPGDISWALSLDEARADLDAIGALPGRIVLLRGNHDYWWKSPSSIRQKLRPGMDVLQNEGLSIGPFVIAGSRGWVQPGSGDSTEEDAKLYRRELIRMELSLKSAQSIQTPDQTLVVMTHFPPFDSVTRLDTPMTRLIESYCPAHVIYGHIHSRFDGYGDVTAGGTRYHLVSCDYLRFTLKQII